MNKEFGAFVTQDPGKCSGCKACELACFTAHAGAPGKTVGTVTTPVIPRLFVTESDGSRAPVQCRHCEDAPCLNACKAGAITRIDCQVIIRTDMCVGCADPVCAPACPFGAIRLLPLPAKCDLCMEQGQPACVRACPNQALRLVDLSADRQEKQAQAARWLRWLY